MNSVVQDVRYALRMLARAPGFTAVAVVSIALGIAANTTIFSLVNALLLRPLPVENPERLMRIGATQRGEGFRALSLAEYQHFKKNAESFSAILAHEPTDVSLSIDGTAESGWCEVVSEDYFSALGIQPALGRAFAAAGENPGAPVTVVSHALWQRRLGGDPRAIGKTLRLNGKLFTVVGIAPRSFSGTFPGFLIDLWIPLGMQGTVRSSGESSVMAIGRLADGASPAQARSELQTLMMQLQDARAESEQSDTGGQRGVSLAGAEGVHPFAAQIVRAFLILLSGAVALVLLMGCANVANLLLARAAARQTEIGIRLALGASRRRLIQQLLTESVLLGLLGGSAGVVLAIWMTRLLSAFRVPTGVPIAVDVKLDGSVLLFTLVISIVAGVIFGLAPAFQSAHAQVVGALKGEAGTARGRRGWLRGALVSLQVALCVILLTAAGLLAGSLQNAREMNVGFDPDGVAVMGFQLQQIGYDRNSASRFYEELGQRSGTIGSVQSVTFAYFVPLGDRGDRTTILVEGYEASEGENLRMAYNIVTPGYFSAMKIPIVVGRDFEPADSAGSGGVAIVSESFARRFWPNQSPLGKRIRRTSVEIHGDRGQPLQVVGVARDIVRSFGDAERALLYLPYAQNPQSLMILHARIAGDPAPALAGIRQLVREMEPDLPVWNTRSLRESMGFSLVPARLAGSVFGFAGGVALLLAITGIFGVASYSVSRRTREIGIRMALGAQRGNIIALVLREGALRIASGLLIGFAGAVALGGALKGLLYGIGATDSPTLLVVAATLCATALAAMAIPARRATQVDPLVALRYE